MKKIITIMLICTYAIASYAQSNVGIGTYSPSQKLHVDSGNIKIGNPIYVADSSSPKLIIGDGQFVTIGEYSQDDYMGLRAKTFNFMPSSAGYSGNVGIGTTAPYANLHVVGSMRLEDGNQGTGQVLTSDNSGNATWQAPPSATPTLSMKVCMALFGVFPSFGGGAGPSPDTYISEIRVFACTQVPNGWIECKGQLLPIAQNSALFALIGTTYGGNGTTNFAVPDLTGKTIIGQ